MNSVSHRLRDGALLFFLLPAVYFLLYGFYGFADTDQGFVPALSWRVLNGQVPYLDFAYVRPPLTPYLHALELHLWPQSLQILGMRLDFYLMLWASVYWGMQTLQRFVPEEADVETPFAKTKWWLASIVFAFSVHNFPAMPWHTVDGIFWSSLGIYGLSHPSSHRRMALGLCALAVAGLAKQPFALMLPLGIIALFFLQPPKVALKAIGIAALALAGGAAVLMYGYFPAGFIQAMLAQTAGASTLADLVKAGVTDYAWPGGVLFLIGLLCFWGMQKISFFKTYPSVRMALMLLALALMTLAWAVWATWKGSFMPPRLGMYHALLLSAGLYTIVLARQGHRQAAVVLCLLSATAWASSLSWGYAVPALFALPGIYALSAFARMRHSQHATPVLIACLGLSLLGFFLLQRFPYRDAPRSEMVAGAGEVFPVLGPIRTGPVSLAKMREYRGFREQYPTAAVLPAMPAADYLMGLQPSIRSDWEHDAEIGPRQIHGAIEALRSAGVPVLVELERLDEATSENLHYRSSLLSEVLARWRPGIKGNFFQLFDPPGATEWIRPMLDSLEEPAAMDR